MALILIVTGCSTVEPYKAPQSVVGAYTTASQAFAGVKGVNYAPTETQCQVWLKKDEYQRTKDQNQPWLNVTTMSPCQPAMVTGGGDLWVFGYGRWPNFGIGASNPEMCELVRVVWSKYERVTASCIPASVRFLK